MEEETRIKEKVETDMEEEKPSTVATTTMKIHVGIKIHRNEIAKIVVVITVAVVQDHWVGSTTRKTLKINSKTKRVAGKIKIKIKTSQ